MGSLDTRQRVLHCALTLCLCLGLGLSRSSFADRVKIDWSPTESAGGYELEVTKDGNVVILKTFAGDVTTWRGQLSPGIFYYRIRSISPGGTQGQWGNRTLFRVLPIHAVLASPSHGEVVPILGSQPVTFRWEPVADVIAYQLEVRKGAATAVSTLVKQISASFPLAPGDYQWRVSPVLTAHEPTTGAVSNFVVSDRASEFCPFRVVAATSVPVRATGSELKGAGSPVSVPEKESNALWLFRAEGIVALQGQGGQSISPEVSWNPIFWTPSGLFSMRGRLGLVLFKSDASQLFPALDYELRGDLSLSPSFFFEAGAGGQTWAISRGGTRPVGALTFGYVDPFPGLSALHALLFGYRFFPVPNFPTHELSIGIEVSL
jgi:hypothetical protein